jgi:hypothetical protein
MLRGEAVQVKLVGELARAHPSSLKPRQGLWGVPQRSTPDADKHLPDKTLSLPQR